MKVLCFAMLKWESHDKQRKGAYKVEITKWSQTEVIFIDYITKGITATVQMKPTASGKLHSHIGTKTPQDWSSYVGTFSVDSVTGDWKREDGAYGKEGTFTIELI